MFQKALCSLRKRLERATLAQKSLSKIQLEHDITHFVRVHLHKSHVTINHILLDF